VCDECYSLLSGQEGQEPTNVIAQTSCDTPDTRHQPHRQFSPLPQPETGLGTGLETKLETFVLPQPEQAAAKLDKTDVSLETGTTGAITSCNILVSEPPNNRNSVELKVN